jgi:proteasome activator subunit 4
LEPTITKNGDQQGKKGTTQGTDGFTAQSKWLYLCCALLVELDETEVDGTMSRVPWYTKFLANTINLADSDQQTAEDLKESWQLVSDKLLPRLIGALGHPYESCRDHISGCLFRICYCHRKMSRGDVSRAPSRSNSGISLASADTQDPGTYIVQKLLALQDSTDPSFQNRYNSLITARRFFSYCIHFGEAKHEYAEYIIPLLPLAFEALKSTVEEGGESTEADTVAKRALEAEVVKGYRYTIAEVSVSSVMSYGGDKDISRVLSTLEKTAKHEFWQVRHACANFLRCFQGSHKFLFTDEHAEKITSIVAELLADDRREVSSAAMAAVTGIIAALPSETVAKLVQKYVLEANRSKMKRKKAKTPVADKSKTPEGQDPEKLLKEQKRARMQQSSVFFLCASVLSQPYDTPPFVPKALAAISKHSFERNAPLGVRDTVKKCCAEYKKTHMSDNWEVHRQVFTQEELEALEDVVSSPHYYA